MQHYAYTALSLTHCAASCQKWVHKKFTVQDQEEDQRGPGERLYERTMNKEDAIDCCKWRKLVKDVR